MTTVTMTITGTEAGADYVLMTCEHGRTGEAIDPPSNEESITDVVDHIQATHRRDTGCDCADSSWSCSTGTARLHPLRRLFREASGQ